MPKKKEKTAEQLAEIEEKKAQKKVKKAEKKELRIKNRAKSKKNLKKKVNKIKKSKFCSALFACGRFFKKIGKIIAIPFLFVGRFIKTIIPTQKIKKIKPPKLADIKAKAAQNPDASRRFKLIRRRVFGVLGMCVAACLVILGGFKIAGALELNAGYAARVGDTYFKEADVTKYITEQTYYKQYAKNLQGWQQYLSMYGMTTETFRKQCIEDKFAHDELVKRACEQEGIEVDEAEVDKHMESFKSKYSSESNYNKALENAGFTEETYRENVRQTMLEKALIAKVITVDAPSDDDVKTYLSSASTTYKDARRSSHILFDSKDTATAQSVLDQINAGTLSFENAVKQYSIDEATKANGGDRGWDKIEKFTTEYNDSLSGLTAGQVYASLVTDKEGIHIVKCTEKWDTPEKIESLDGVPQAIIEECRTKKTESNQQTELKTWLTDFASQNGIETVVFPMRGGLPYYTEVKSSGNSGLSTSATTSSS